MAASWTSIDDNLISYLNESEDTGLVNHINELSNERVNLASAKSKISDFKVYQRQVEKKATTNISVAPYFKGDGSYDNFKFSYFIGAFSDKNRITQGSSNYISAERFGLGIKIDLSITNLESSVNLGFGMIAAAVKMGVAQAQYSYNIYALPNGQFHDQLPKVGKFDTESIKGFQNLVKKLKELYVANFNKLDLVAIEVLLSKSIEEEGTENSHSYYFAARRIIERKSLKEAISQSRQTSREYNEDAIQYIYSRVGLLSFEEQPSSKSIDLAKNILIE